jgi:hypothetical protein
MRGTETVWVCGDSSVFLPGQINLPEYMSCVCVEHVGRQEFSFLLKKNDRSSLFSPEMSPDIWYTEALDGALGRVSRVSPTRWVVSDTMGRDGTREQVCVRKECDV